MSRLRAYADPSAVRERVGYIWFDGWAVNLPAKLEPALVDLRDTDMRTPKGRRIEGHGIAPDVAAELRQADLLAGKDTVIEKAIETLAKR